MWCAILGRQVWELFHMDRQLDNEQALLQRLHDEDTLRFIAFADRPGWVERRLADARDDGDRK